MKRFFAIVGLVLLQGLCSLHAESAARWTEDKANDWYANKKWLVGCNFSPSTAINQLEMWQAESFDTATIDRELGMAESLGFTSIRVFLHNLLWKQDSAGFLKRMDEFLALAQKHHIGVMFVIFDSCWDPDPKLGKQHAPKPHLHNSGWVQSPGREYIEHPERWDELKAYVEGVIGHFKDDKRIDFWDLYNEPDNMNDPAYIKIESTNKVATTVMLLKKTFTWAREANPSQPVTSGVWLGPWADVAKLSPTEKVQLENSDIVTFHNYSRLMDAEACVHNLHRYHRPVICTEYMARPAGSTFDPELGWFKHEHVGAYNWGFVAGKTQTIYPWDSWRKSYSAEPTVLFHDILRPDGTPLVPGEVEYIKSVTK